nr:AHH domain-containing protein [Bacillus wiedmannii]
MDTDTVTPFVKGVEILPDGSVVRTGTNYSGKFQEAHDASKASIQSRISNLESGGVKGTGKVTKDVDKIDYGAYLKKNIGDPPKDMYDPHAHHIVFKKGNGKVQKELVKEGQEILKEYDIDPILGLENLVWAPNRVKGQHGIEALRNVVDNLKKVRDAGGDRDDILKMLNKLGDIAKRRK